MLAQYPATPLLSADQQLSALLTESDHAKVLGDHAAAIKGYEEALDRLHSDAALKNRLPTISLFHAIHRGRGVDGLWA